MECMTSAKILKVYFRGYVFCTGAPCSVIFVALLQLRSQNHQAPSPPLHQRLRVEITPESIIDYGSLPFGGLKGDAYKFKISGGFFFDGLGEPIRLSDGGEGDFQDVKTLENNVDESLPAAAIAASAEKKVFLDLVGDF